MIAAGRKWPQVNSSSRLHITFTGFPVARANRAASNASSCACLPPKPSPKSGTTMRTLASGRPSASASDSRDMNGTWLPTWTVTRSPSHSASAARGSIGTCAMNAVRYVAVTRTGAAARAPAQSPTSWWTGPSQPTLSTGWLRRCASSSPSEGCGVRSHWASIVPSASRASSRSAETTPTKPSVSSTVTPGWARARRQSAERSLAPNAGGRSTQP